MLNTTCSAKERGGNGRANVMQYREMRDDGSNVETSRWDVVLYHIALSCIALERIIGNMAGQCNAG
jgi:hypothetical protein